MTDIVFAVGVVAFAAMVQGLSGFGFGMVSMGLLALVLPVTEAVPIVSLLGLVVTTSLLIACRRALRLRDVLPLLGGSLLGVPLGVWFLTGVDPTVVLRTLGVVLVVFALHGLLASGAADRLDVADRAEPEPEPERGWVGLTGAAAGALGGALGGAFNVGGPPLIVYVTWRRLAPAAMKASLQCCFLLMSCLQIPLFVHHGIVTRDTVVTAAAGLPSIAVGLAAGLLVGRRISRRAFRRIVLALLLALGVWFLIR